MRNKQEHTESQAIPTGNRSRRTRKSPRNSQAQPPKAEIKKKLWYCKQCGYVVYREDPPYVCPICKAKREMFAEIETKIEFKG